MVELSRNSSLHPCKIVNLNDIERFHLYALSCLKSEAWTRDEYERYTDVLIARAVHLRDGETENNPQIGFRGLERRK